MLVFDFPEIFYLLPLPILVWLLLPAAKSAKKTASLHAPFSDTLQTVSGEDAGKAQSRLPLSLLLVWVLLIISAAQPRQIGDPVELPAAARDLMIAVDISGSMKIEDMAVNGKTANRLQALKLVVNDFIQKREGDRLGLVLFGSNAYIQSPLTLDINTVSAFLEEAEIGIAGPNTAIGDAIALTLKRLLENKDSTEKILILVTDGANTAGSIEPTEAARLAASEGMKIYTIGVGADRMEVSGFFRNRVVNPSRDLDEDALQSIASLTGGRYFRAKNTEDLAGIYDIINQVEPVEVENEIYRPSNSVFYIPLAAAFVISLVIGLSNLVAPWLMSRSFRTEAE